MIGGQEEERLCKKGDRELKGDCITSFHFSLKLVSVATKDDVRKNSKM